MVSHVCCILICQQSGSERRLSVEGEDDLQLPSTAPWPVHDDQKYIVMSSAESRVHQHSIEFTSTPYLRMTLRLSVGRHDHLI